MRGSVGRYWRVVVGTFLCFAASHCEAFRADSWGMLLGFPMPRSEVGVDRAEETFPGKPIPSGPDAVTARRLAEQRADTWAKVGRECYDRVGVHDARWDGLAREFLPHYAQRAAGKDLNYELLTQLRQEAAAIEAAGCEDPWLLYCVGNLKHQVEGARPAQPLLERAFKLLASSRYPRCFLFLAARRLESCCEAVLGRGAAPTRQARQAKVRYLAEAFADDIVRGGNERLLLAEFQQEWSRLSSMGEREALLKAAKAVPNASPWLLALLEGGILVDKGWELRGGGWASEVTEDGWRGFRENLAAARTLLTQAYEANPQFPETASMMIPVAMATEGPQAARDWFDKAVAAQMDYTDAYDRLFWALRPRWGGSHKAMLDFGNECLNTKRFDTRVPGFYVCAVSGVGEDMKSMRQALEVPHVLDTLLTAMDRYVADPQAGVSLVWCRSWKVLAFAELGRYEEARSVLDEIKGPLDAGVLKQFTTTEVELRGRLKAATGEWGTGAAEGQRLLSDGNPGEAAARFLAAIDTCPAPAEFAIYLLRTAPHLELKPPFASATGTVALLQRLGLRALLADLYAACVHREGADSIPPDLKQCVTEVLGEEAMAFTAAIPAERKLNEEQIQAYLGQIESIAQELLPVVDRSSAADPEHRMLQTQKSIAEIRIIAFSKLEWQARNKFGVKELMPRLDSVRHSGLGLDFVTRQLQGRRCPWEMRETLAYWTGRQLVYQREKDQGNREATLSRLAGISEPTALKIACWEEYADHGGCVVALKMARLLRERKLEFDAALFEQFVQDWLAVYTDGDSYGVPIRMWAAAYQCNALPGYESQVLQYARRAYERGPTNSICCLAADACLRVGSVEGAVTWLTLSNKSDDKAGQDDDPINTAEGTFNQIPAYRVALFRRLLAAPKATDALLRPLADAFPDEMEQADQPAGGQKQGTP